MRTGRPFEATLSNATVLQLLQAIKLRVTAAFWFEAHQKSLRVAEANARGKQALQPAVEHVVAARVLEGHRALEEGGADSRHLLRVELVLHEAQHQRALPY